MEIILKKSPQRRLLKVILVFVSLTASRGSPENKLEPRPGAGISKPAKVRLVDRWELVNYREADYARMTLDNPHLVGAYLQVLMRMPFLRDRTAPQGESFEKAAYADLQRRGDSVVPLLLRLCSENQYSHVEQRVIYLVQYTPEINPELFLDYVRKSIKDRGQLLGVGISEGFGNFLARFGSGDDIALLKQWTVERPYIAELLPVWLTRASIERAEARVPPHGAPSPVGKKEEPKTVTATEKQPDTPTTSAWRLTAILSITLVPVLLVFFLVRGKRV